MALGLLELLLDNSKEPVESMHITAVAQLWSQVFDNPFDLMPVYVSLVCHSLTCLQLRLHCKVASFQSFGMFPRVICMQ